MKKIIFLFLLFYSALGLTQVNENFDAWTGSTAYSNYTYNGFQITNGLRETSAANVYGGSGSAVRLRNSSPSPSLEYIGLDGNGKDGGVGNISFWYRHWDGSPALDFVVEVDVNGGGYVNIGSITGFTSTAYTQFSYDLNEISDNVKIRITSNFAERLLIDQFSITDYTGTPSPLITVNPNIINGLNYIEGSGPSSSQSFTIDASNLTPVADNLVISASSNIEVSLDDTTFSSSINLPYTASTISSQTVYVRLISGLLANSYSDTVTISGGGASDASVSVSGNVTSPFLIPYFNGFRLQTDYDMALAQGFFSSGGVVFTTSAGGYIRIPLNDYIETPTIDFSQHSNLFVQFSSTTFGGSTGQELTLSYSEDNGVTYTTVGTITVPSSYEDFKLNVDVSASVSTNGKLKLELTNGGSGSARVRDFLIDSSVVWNGVSWSNITGPTSNLIAIIEGDYNTTTNGSFIAKQVEVNSGNFTINASTNIEIINALNVNNTSSFSIDSDGVLLQQNDVNNSGSITVTRESAPMIRLDYTAWSSPVVNQNLLAFSPNTVTNRFYTYDSAGNSWSSIDPSVNNFSIGSGYLIRVPNTWSASTYSAFDGVFTGVPNNGNYTASTAVGFNLIGNPYPSPIDADSFIADNSSVLTTGTLYFWTHTVPQDGSYTSQSNYASYTTAGGVAATAGGAQPDGIIQVGQGYLTDVNSASSVQFNNLQRLGSSSGQFFKSSSTVERHRYWLNLSDNSNNYNQMMVAYMTGATNGIDFGIDGKLFTNSLSSIGSLVNNESYVIQGRALSFDVNDEVPLIFKAETSGNYSISLEQFDGLFANQDLFIWDKQLNIIHDIKTSAYNFSTIAGEFTNRFSVVYSTSALSENNFSNESQVIVYEANNNMIINAGKNIINQVAIYDIQGRKLFSKEKLNSTETIIENTWGKNQVLIVEIYTDKGKTVKKVLL